jgi:hypothetical protein
MVERGIASTANLPANKRERCVNPNIANMSVWGGEASLDGIDFHRTGEDPA